MKNKQDEVEWSHWQCAICGCEQEDPDAMKATTCCNGHTNYLGPVEGNWRRAYKSSAARAKDIREHNALVELWDRAIYQARLQIKKSGRKPLL